MLVVIVSHVVNATIVCIKEKQGRFDVSFPCIKFCIFRQRCQLRICLSVNKKMRDRLLQQAEDHESEPLEGAASYMIDSIDEVPENNDVSYSDELSLSDSHTVSTDNDPTEVPVESEPQVAETKRRKVSFKCVRCGKLFLKKSYARNHCTKESKSWVCEFCGTEIKQLCNVNRHKQRCSNKKNMGKVKSSTTYTCEVCDKSFPIKGNMFRHLRENHGIDFSGTFKCQQENCKFSTDSKGQLKRHITLIHSQAPDIQCDQCEHICVSVSGLNKHKLKIHGFECSYCRAVFKTDKMLSCHVKVHANLSIDNLTPNISAPSGTTACFIRVVDCGTEVLSVQSKSN